MYVELHCRSNFSFLTGASHPEELAERAAQLGYPALALTDRDGLYGAVRFAKACKAAGIKAIVGAEIGGEGAPGPLVLLATSVDGYRNLCRLLSRAQMAGRKGAPVYTLDDLAAHGGELLCLSGGRDGEIARAFLAGRPDAARAIAERYREIFGADRFIIEVSRQARPVDARLSAQLVALARRLGLTCVATNDVYYHVQERARLADVLTCIKHRTTLDRAGSLLRPNAEHYLKSPAEMAALFADLSGHPTGDPVRTTLAVAERCSFDLTTLGYRYPAFPVPAGETPFSYLYRLCQTGAQTRYRPMTPAVARQLQHELDVIERLGLAEYFLIVWDIMRYAREQGILGQGRGSAANSVVAYVLGITNVDPIALGLLFERFLSEERAGLPDIDVDFANKDRERVIQYVYNRYGRDHAGMVCEVISYRPRSAIRDIGKALGLSPEQVDVLAKSLERGAGGRVADPSPGPSPTGGGGRTPLSPGPSPTAGGGERRADPSPGPSPAGRGEGVADLSPGLSPTGGGGGRMSLSAGLSAVRGEEIVASSSFSSLPLRGEEPYHPFPPPWGKGPGVGGVPILVQLARAIEGFPRHLGIHVGGMIVTRDPLIETAPVEPATMPGRTVTQWDKDDVEDLGIVKIDILGLGMLSLLQDCLRLIRQHRGHDVDLGRLPQDPAVYDMLCRADTVGLFQVESRAQMATLPRLKPRTFYDLVVEVALIRPGPIQGEMVHPYLRRRNGEEPVTYPHPSLEPIMKKTLGVCLFQEQGMKVAIAAAGFSPGKADQLRRAMGHKRSREQMARLFDDLVEGMRRNGIAEQAALTITKQLSAFADYGFPESHAASFAHIVYASAYLKLRYPVEFTCALLNNQPMGFYQPSVVVGDAKRHGVRVLPVDVNRSRSDCTVEGNAVRLGYRYVRGIGEAHFATLDAAAETGPYRSLADFCQRTRLPRESIEHLIQIGAFDGLDIPRRNLLWQLPAVLRRGGSGPLPWPLPHGGRGEDAPLPRPLPHGGGRGERVDPSPGPSPTGGGEDAHLFWPLPRDGGRGERVDPSPGPSPTGGWEGRADPSPGSSSTRGRERGAADPLGDCEPPVSDEAVIHPLSLRTHGRVVSDGGGSNSLSLGERAGVRAHPPVPARLRSGDRGSDCAVVRPHPNPLPEGEGIGVRDLPAGEGIVLQALTAGEGIGVRDLPAGEGTDRPLAPPSLAGKGAGGLGSSPPSPAGKGAGGVGPTSSPVQRGGELPLVAPADEAVRFPPLTDLEAARLDFGVLGLSPKHHALEFYRSQLDRRHVITAAALADRPDRSSVTVAGIVVCRQMPPTAKGHVFLTMEDETGLFNVVIRPQTYADAKALVRGSPLLIVHGVLQRQDGALSILARRFEALDSARATRWVLSRDFH